VPPKPGGTLRAASGLQVPGTALPAVIRAARATRTPVFLPPARFSRAYPPVAAAPLRVDGCHTTRTRTITRGACFARHTGSGIGPVRSPPLVCRSGIFVGQRTGRRVAGSLRAGRARRRFSKNVVGAVGAHLDFSAGIPATPPRGVKKLVRHDPHPEVNPTGSTLPPRACARHTCIAPSGERLTSTQSA